MSCNCVVRMIDSAWANRDFLRILGLLHLQHGSLGLQEGCILACRRGEECQLARRRKHEAVCEAALAWYGGWAICAESLRWPAERGWQRGRASCGGWLASTPQADYSDAWS